MFISTYCTPPNLTLLCPHSIQPVTEVNYLPALQCEINTFLVDFPFDTPTSQTVGIVTMQWKGNIHLLFFFLIFL